MSDSLVRAFLTLTSLPAAPSSASALLREQLGRDGAAQWAERLPGIQEDVVLPNEPGVVAQA